MCGNGKTFDSKLALVLKTSFVASTCTDLYSQLAGQEGRSSTNYRKLRLAVVQKSRPSGLSRMRRKGVASLTCWRFVAHLKVFHDASLVSVSDSCETSQISCNT